MYRQLDTEKTIDAIHVLRNRIEERFPGSSLSGVCRELYEVAGETRKRVEWISRPHFLTRFFVLSFVVLSIFLVWYGTREWLRVRTETFGIAELVSLTEAATNELIVVGAALIFLFGIELRIKRTRSLRILHDLRAMAHVIDMHQLKKDPSLKIWSHGTNTKSSPVRTMTAFELHRYLDYCSEMLSLIGKIAALYAQSLPDSVVVGAANDVEVLTNGLSRKLWQKISMIQDDTDATSERRISITGPEATGDSPTDPAVTQV